MALDRDEFTRWQIAEQPKRTNIDPRSRDLTYTTPLEVWIEQAKLQDFIDGFKITLALNGMNNDDIDPTVRTTMILLRQAIAPKD